MRMTLVERYSLFQVPQDLTAHDVNVLYFDVVCITLPSFLCLTRADGTPIGNFDFLQPLCTARGVRGPLMQLPVALALQLANLSESIYYLSKKILGDRHAVEPFLTVPEVLKVSSSFLIPFEVITY
jgi:hypothetical protein